MVIVKHSIVVEDIESGETFKIIVRLDIGETSARKGLLIEKKNKKTNRWHSVKNKNGSTPNEASLDSAHIARAFEELLEKVRITEGVSESSFEIIENWIYTLLYPQQEQGGSQENARTINTDQIQLNQPEHYIDVKADASYDSFALDENEVRKGKGYRVWMDVKSTFTNKLSIDPTFEENESFSKPMPPISFKDPDRNFKKSRHIYNYKVPFVDLLYATDRGIEPQNGGIKYGHQRSELSYGRCLVTIPASHKYGKIEEPFSFFGFTMSEDADEHIIVQEIFPLDKVNFYQELLNRLTQDGTDNSLLLFIHGYNNSFTDAAKRSAQIHHDLKFKGTSMFYSWPSYNEVLSYPKDEANVEYTVFNLTTLLSDLLASELENIYIIGHSMGNRAITRAITASIQKQPEGKIKIKELILAAPDIDADVFKNEIAPNLLALVNRVTLYASSNDKALLASKQFHGNPRLGDTGKGVATFSGMDSIDASDVETDFLGHSTALSTRTILADIFDLISNKSTVDRRFGLVKVESQPLPYWKFRSDD